MKKSLLSLAALAAAASCGAVWAEDAAAPAAAAPASAAATPAPAAEASSPLSFNIGLVSLYKYRGQDQYFTGSEHYSRPALQGGVDYAFSNGLYLGNWNSTIKLPDPTSTSGKNANVEMDFYGGYKFATGPLGWDVGVLRYQYPGANALSTTELYAGATYKELTLKYSHTVSSKYFGLENGRNTGYLNLAWAHPLRDGLTLNASVGHTFMTSDVRAAGLPSYTDYSVGVAWDFMPKTTLTAAFVGADKASNYGYVNKGKAIVGVKYTF